MEYATYLKSEDWKDKRSLKKKTNSRCAICSSNKKLDTHHLNYKNLVDVQQSDLRVLCHRCHFLAHDLMKNGKIVFRSTNHHSRFTIIKSAVKKSLGLSNINLFRNCGAIQKPGVFPKGFATKDSLTVSLGTS